MRRFFMAVALVVTCILLVRTCIGQTMYAVCDKDSKVNIRLKANVHSEVIGYLLDGYDIEVIQQKNGWYYVHANCEYEYGYVKAQFLSNEPPIQVRTMRVVSDGRVHIRKSPNGKATGSYYHDGDIVTITAISNRYAKTEKGWVSIDYLEEIDDAL